MKRAVRCPPAAGQPAQAAPAVGMNRVLRCASKGNRPDKAPARAARGPALGGHRHCRTRGVAEACHSALGLLVALPTACCAERSAVTDAQAERSMLDRPRTLLFRRPTFELSGRHRRSGLALDGTMYWVAREGPSCSAGGGPLERRVRRQLGRHSTKNRLNMRSVSYTSTRSGPVKPLTQSPFSLRTSAA